ncbi:MAG TPA: hypothetical protein VFB32_16655 [Rudaea sp.]|nr:hypothetical protein [Rudaea sp.]
MSVRRAISHPAFALGAGVLALGACAALGAQSPRENLLSYLWSYWFWLGIPLGGAVLLLVHALTGGEWGERLRIPLVASTRTLPLFAVLVLPLVIGNDTLYGHVAADETLAYARQIYMGMPFVACRAVVYFGLLMLVSRAATARPTPGAAAAGVIVYAFVLLAATADWSTRLVPGWHSSAAGLIAATAQIGNAAAFAALYICVRDALGGGRGDIGLLLLTLVLAWAYVLFMEYLTVWTADLPAETAWYLPRTETTWRRLSLSLAIVHGVLPFALLLSPAVRRSARGVGAAAALLLVGGALDACWRILPSARRGGVVLHPSDALAFLGIGACWWAALRYTLHRDSHLDEAPAHG